MLHQRKKETVVVSKAFWCCTIVVRWFACIQFFKKWVEYNIMQLTAGTKEQMYNKRSPLRKENHREIKDSADSTASANEHSCAKHKTEMENPFCVEAPQHAAP